MQYAWSIVLQFNLLGTFDAPYKGRVGQDFNSYNCTVSYLKHAEFYYIISGQPNPFTYMNENMS